MIDDDDRTPRMGDEDTGAAPEHTPPPPPILRPPSLPTLPPVSENPGEGLDMRPPWMRHPDEIPPPDGYAPLAETPATPAEPTPLGAATFTLGLVAGVAAAVAGAIAWGVAALWSGGELGVLAWAIGLLVGVTIRFVTRRRGPELQTIGVVCSLGGILLGKYLAFALLANDELGLGYGLVSSEMIDFFRTSTGDVFSAFDLLWVGLAVGTAWAILVPPDPQGAAVDDYHTRNPVDRLTRRLPRSLRIAADWIVTIVGAVAIVLLVKAFIVNPYRIPSSSMEPTLHCARPGTDCQARFSDRVLANRFVYHFRSPKRGEIVVFETPPNACGVGGTFVKRIVGLPGDKLELRLIRGDAYVFVNGKKLDEPYVRDDRRQVSSSFGPITVPPGHYFMLGDNREQSCDSREWGALPRDNLIGKVFATYWPPTRLSLH